jgi:hypothetical protein
MFRSGLTGRFYDPSPPARAKATVERVDNALDAVAHYARALGFSARSRTVLVEGTRDVALFELGADLERSAGGSNLLGHDLAIVAAGEGDLGGTRGVIREFIGLRALARTCLLPNGRPRYRFIALFDNDKAGRMAIKALREFDSSILEYKDVFRLWPAMPTPANVDPSSMQRAFEKENASYKGLDWELEDFLPPSFVHAFEEEHPGAVAHTVSIEGKVHRDLTSDGKAHFHRFIKQNAIRDDLSALIDVLKAVRFYLGLK